MADGHEFNWATMDVSHTVNHLSFGPFCKYTCVCVFNIYIYIYIHTYIHTYIAYTRTRTHTWKFLTQSITCHSDHSVSIHVCVYSIYIYIYIHTYIHCIHTHTHTYMEVSHTVNHLSFGPFCKYICTHTYIYVCMYVCMHSLYVHIHTCVCRHTHGCFPHSQSLVIRTIL